MFTDSVCALGHRYSSLFSSGSIRIVCNKFIRILAINTLGNSKLKRTDIRLQYLYPMF